MNALGYSLFEQASLHSGVVSVEDALAETSLVFTEQYERLVRLHKEDNTYDKLLQIVCGPVMNVQRSDLDLLLKYGLIRLGEDGRYTAFSEHFGAYLDAVGYEVDYWPLWRATER